MKHKLLFLISLFIILFSISVYSDSYSVVWGDDFDEYIYTDGNWAFSTTADNRTNYPIKNVYTDSTTFGYNATATGSIGNYHTTYLTQSPPTPFTSGILKITFDVYFGNTTLSHATNKRFSVFASNNTQLAPTVGVNYPLLHLEFTDSSVNITRQYKTTAKSYFCGYNLIRPYYIDVEWYIDIDNKKTTLFIYNISDGSTLVSCENQNFLNWSTEDGGLTNINKFVFFAQDEEGVTEELFIDNFYVYIANTSSSSNLPVLSYCTVDANCLTGYCLNNKCSYKAEDMDCTSGSECLSGNCINSHCVKADLTDSLNNYWNSLGAFSTGSKLLIGIIIMIAVVILFGMATGFNALVMIIMTFVSLFVVIYIGLFPLWIVILIILLAGVIFFSFFRQGGN